MFSIVFLFLHGDDLQQNTLFFLSGAQLMEQNSLFVHAVERFMLQKQTNKDIEIANGNISLISGLYIFCDVKKIIWNSIALTGI